MTTVSRSADSLAAHAVCAAAGVRDGLRAAQFYVRDLSNADGGARGDDRHAPFLSRFVGGVARTADRFMTWSANAAISILLPGWRKLPSPFTPGLMHEVANGIRENSLVHNPLFNAYFFRAALHIIGRYSEPPCLVLEHRVDAARRSLAALPALPDTETEFLARTLIALAGHAPVARIGRIAERHRFFGLVDPNIAVSAIACVALLFAEEGKPTVAINEDEFFTVTGALIGPRLNAIADLVARNDESGLARELADIKSMY